MTCHSSKGFFLTFAANDLNVSLCAFYSYFFSRGILEYLSNTSHWMCTICAQVLLLVVTSSNFFFFCSGNGRTVVGALLTQNCNDSSQASFDISDWLVGMNVRRYLFHPCCSVGGWSWLTGPRGRPWAPRSPQTFRWQGGCPWLWTHTSEMLLQTPSQTAPARLIHSLLKSFSGCCAVATFALNKLQSRRNRVFYLASGTFPAPPRSPCGASILMGARETEM